MPARARTVRALRDAVQTVGFMLVGVPLLDAVTGGCPESPHSPGRSCCSASQSSSGPPVRSSTAQRQGWSDTATSLTRTPPTTRAGSGDR